MGQCSGDSLGLDQGATAELLRCLQQLCWAPAANVQSRLQRMVAAHLSSPCVGDARQQIKLSRTPNMLMLLSHEHALSVGAGIALSDSLPSCPLAPISADEKRYAIDAQDLPAGVVSSGQKQRSCIKNTRTNERRLECTDSSSPLGLCTSGLIRAASGGRVHTTCSSAPGSPARSIGTRPTASTMM